MNRKLASLLLSLGVLTPGSAQEFTRGVGVYPGHPKEDFSPTPKPDTTYRNLALNRAAYQSSAHDYNATAQLITDGILEKAAPRRLVVSTSAQGVLGKDRREKFLDQNLVSTVELKGVKPWIQVDLGGEAFPEVDRLQLIGSVHMAQSYVGLENWACAVSGSEDGKTWKPLGQASGMTRRGGEFDAPIAFAPSRFRFYRLEFDDARAMTWGIEEVGFYAKGQRVPIGGPFDFASAWMSAGSGQEWVYVDLGAECRFDRVVLHWIRRASEGSLQVSKDASTWETLKALPSAGSVDDLKVSGQGRYVRVLMNRAASSEGYALGELQVFGTGGPVPQPKAAPALRKDGRLELAGGAWRLQRASLVKEGGDALSKPGYGAADWIVATVPGTVLTSYLNAGAVPNPDFGDHQLAISDSFFCADFWYRDEFVATKTAPGRKVWLNFEGINWKAEVYLNGAKLGRIEGGFLRKRFDITGLVKPGEANAVAVRIERNATPGSVKEKTYENPDNNGGALGADNPTAHATIGWDWIPTIRGRDIGIWGKVALTQSGAVTLDDPSVNTVLPLPDTSSADITLGVTVQNHEAKALSGKLKGRFGEIAFEAPVTLEAGASKRVVLDPKSTPALRIRNPKLWWPTGYGEPNLYPVELSFVAEGAVSDLKSFQAGIRQFTSQWTPEHSDLPDARTLKLWVNGRHFIPKGGNWGFPESMLRYRGREYDAALRYHRDMHFNMIRNWVGQTGDDELFEACDRHGIVVWQDFWLANPWDGPDPDDQTMFMANATDFVRRIRSHASVGLYCGRNEGYPIKPLDDAIRTLLKELHADVPYISSSADDEVAGHGPYMAMPLKSYFEKPPKKIHSEMGMPNIMSLDSVRMTMPEADIWPMGRVWGLHDFCLGGAQGGSSFLDSIRRNYGEVENAKDFLDLAQFVNFEGHRAMFEAQSQHRLGLLMWMSHPTWPSFVWQTYDYFLEPTAAYYGIKKACEPLHIQWNPATDTVEVVNYSAGLQQDLTATAQLLNLEGRVVWEKSAALRSEEDSTLKPMTLERPAGLSSIYFIRLKLSRGTEVLSENLYCRGLREGDLQGLRKLPKAEVSARTTVKRSGSRWILTTQVKNLATTPVLGLRLKAVREKSGDRILPALTSDNYLTLMPGEGRTLSTELEHADTRGEKPAIRIEGFNVGEIKP